MFTRIISFFLLVALLAGCTSLYTEVYQGTDAAKKYELATSLYQEEDYNRAIKLFDQVIPVYRGTPQAERASFFIADAHFKNENYGMAAHHFDLFVKTYPQSSKAEEAMYNAAYCAYVEVPRFNLDDTGYSAKAIEGFQSFIKQYPNSEKTTQANQYIDELNQRLEKKSYQVALLYHRMGQYKVAVTAMNNVLDEFPGGKLREEALYHLALSSVELARNSVESKQLQRWIEARTNCRRLLQSFPNSQYKEKVTELGQEVDKNIQTL